MLPGSARRNRGRPCAEHEPGHVPELVAEVASVLQLLGPEPGVGAGAGPVDQGKAECVGAYLVDRGQRVDRVALRLGHLLAERIPNQPGQVDRVERRLAGQVDAQHHHPGDPEEDDVVGGLHDRARVEAAEVLRVVGPAERGKWPQARAEPGVEDVLVLLQL